MRRTVLGVVDNQAEAKEVEIELRNIGFLEDEIEVVKPPVEKQEHSVTTVYSKPRDMSMSERIAEFFRSITTIGADTEAGYREDEAYYAGELNRGRCVLIIRAENEGKADRASVILSSLGADNVALSAEQSAEAQTPIPAGTHHKTARAAVAGSSRPLTASERTEGRVRGLRVYDHSPDRPADLSEPQQR
jgi:hypothetical protein